MKRMFVFILLLLTSCLPGTITHIPKETTFFGIDFTKYTDRGFLITPEKYTGDYYSVGMVNYVIAPAAKYVVTKSYVNANQITVETKEWRVDKIDISEGLDSLYSVARRMGGNAIINFHVDPVVRDYSFSTNPIKITGYHLTGFAIRRKEP